MWAGLQLVESSRLLDSFDYRHCCKHTFELNALHKNANNLCQPGIFHLSLTSVLLFQCQPKSSSTAADLVRRRRLLLGQVGHFFSSSLERGFGLPQWLHSEHSMSTTLLAITAKIQTGHRETISEVWTIVNGQNMFGIVILE